MAEKSTGEQSPFETWQKLIEATMKGYPAARGTNKPGQVNAQDPWIALIDQLWQINPLHNLLPVDPAEITRAFQQIWMDAFRNPGRFWTAYSDFVQRYTQLMGAATLKYWGYDQQSEPLVTPEKGDKRFSAPDWEQNPVFDALKRGTLLAMALPYLAAQGDETVSSASFFVSLLDFSEVGDTSVFIDESQVAYIEAQMWAVNPIRQSLQFLVPTC